MRRETPHTLLVEVLDTENRFYVVKERALPPLLLPFAGGESGPLTTVERTPLQAKKLPLGETDVVIGFEEDPCHPFAPRFERTMRILEQLVRAEPRSVTINTRSPLLVIALPVLQSFGDRLTINVALETHDDESAQHALPHLPRPSERIKLIRALKNFGLNVTLQISPVLPYNRERKKGFELALQLRKLSLPMRVYDFREIARPCTSASPRSHHQISTEAHKQVLHILSELSPEYLLDGASERVAA